MDNTGPIKIKGTDMLAAQGHVIDPTIRHRYECIICGMGWPHGASNGIARQGPCPGQRAIYGIPPAREKPWRILIPTVTVGYRETHTSHAGGLYWLKGILFCMKCGHYSKMPGGRITKLGERCMVKDRKERRYILNLMSTYDQPPPEGKGVATTIQPPQ